MMMHLLRSTSTSTASNNNNSNNNMAATTSLEVEIVVKDNNNNNPSGGEEVVERKFNLRLSLPSSISTGILKSCDVRLIQPLGQQAQQQQQNRCSTITPSSCYSSALSPTQYKQQQEQHNQEQYHYPQVPLSSAPAPVSAAFASMAATAVDVAPSDKYCYDTTVKDSMRHMMMLMSPRPLPPDYNHTVAAASTTSLSPLPSVTPSCDITLPTAAAAAAAADPCCTKDKKSDCNNRNSSYQRNHLPLKKRILLPLDSDSSVLTSSNKRARREMRRKEREQK